MTDHTALDPVALARDLIRIDSVNSNLVPGAAGEAEIAGWCAEWLGRRGFEVHRLGTEEHPTVVGVARGTGGGSSLMLNGHLDTVGVASYDGDPFASEVRGERLLGRGAFDMKGGVAAILVAAARAAADGRARAVIVTLVAPEELGRRGPADAPAAVTADAAIVTEPSELNLVLAHRGFAWFEIEFVGLAAHGSMPHQGVDAIAHAGLVQRPIDAHRVRLEAAPPHPLLGHGAVRVSMISGGTDAATVADSCTLTVERRTLPGETRDAVEAELVTILDGLAAGTADFRYALRRLVARGSPGRGG